MLVRLSASAYRAVLILSRLKIFLSPTSLVSIVDNICNGLRWVLYGKNIYAIFYFYKFTKFIASIGLFINIFHRSIVFNCQFYEKLFIFIEFKNADESHGKLFFFSPTNFKAKQPRIYEDLQPYFWKCIIFREWQCCQLTRG